jgi:hypothetical protein
MPPAAATRSHQGRFVSPEPTAAPRLRRLGRDRGLGHFEVEQSGGDCTSAQERRDLAASLHLDLSTPAFADPEYSLPRSAGRLRMLRVESKGE